jgi:hypothetical protein
MRKDILVDNSIAKNFCNPLDPHYRIFIQWLFHQGELVVTRQLLNEYHASTGSSSSTTNIVVIISKLTISGRLHSVSKQKLKAFKIPNRIERRLRSNRKDWDSLKAVMLSDRKLALSRDSNFVFDVNNYPGFFARAEQRPQDLNYT